MINIVIYGIKKKKKMEEIKGEICKFGNALMDVPHGEGLILDSFALMYIHLKETKKVGYEYQLLDGFFDNLGLTPQINEEKNVCYKKVKKEENIKQQKFFKKKVKFGEKNFDKRYFI